MSLINDALKKAGRSHRDPASPPPTAAPAPTPVEPTLAPAPPPASGNRGFAIGAMAVLAVVLLLSGWFVRDWWEDNRPKSEETEPLTFGAGGEAAAPWRPAAEPPAAPPQSAVKVEPTAGAPSVPGPGDRPAETAVPQPVATAAVAATAPAVATPPASPVVPATPAFPALRLQGIVFRLKDPSALINGKTLYVGDEINGVRVVKIERLSATVSYAGETKTLVMR